MATVREGHQAVLRGVDGQVGALREAWDSARLTSRCEPSPRTLRLTLRLTLRRRSLLWSALGLAVVPRDP